MNWNAKAFQSAFTEWLLGELDRRGIKHAAFSRQAGIDTRADGRAFRRAKSGDRLWKVTDICKIANFFDLSPTEVIEKVEKLYKSNIKRER
jgi:hypothetical protein